MMEKQQQEDEEHNNNNKQEEEGEEADHREVDDDIAAARRFRVEHDQNQRAAAAALERLQEEEENEQQQTESSGGNGDTTHHAMVTDDEQSARYSFGTASLGGGSISTGGSIGGGASLGGGGESGSLSQTNRSLVDQARNFENLLRSQRTLLGNDLTATPTPSNREEDDDDQMQTELRELGNAEELLRMELELFQTEQQPSFLDDEHEMQSEMQSDEEEEDGMEAFELELPAELRRTSYASAAQGASFPTTMIPSPLTPGMAPLSPPRQSLLPRFSGGMPPTAERTPRLSNVSGTLVSPPPPLSMASVMASTPLLPTTPLSNQGTPTDISFRTEPAEEESPPDIPKTQRARRPKRDGDEVHTDNVLPESGGEADTPPQPARAFFPDVDTSPHSNVTSDSEGGMIGVSSNLLSHVDDDVSPQDDSAWVTDRRSQQHQGSSPMVLDADVSEEIPSNNAGHDQSPSGAGRSPMERHRPTPTSTQAPIDVLSANAMNLSPSLAERESDHWSDDTMEISNLPRQRPYSPFEIAAPSDMETQTTWSGSAQEMVLLPSDRSGEPLGAVPVAKQSTSEATVVADMTVPLALSNLTASLSSNSAEDAKADQGVAATLPTTRARPAVFDVALQGAATAAAAAAITSRATAESTVSPPELSSTGHPDGLNTTIPFQRSPRISERGTGGTSSSTSWITPSRRLGPPPHDSPAKNSPPQYEYATARRAIVVSPYSPEQTEGGESSGERDHLASDERVLGSNILSSLESQVVSPRTASATTNTQGNLSAIEAEEWLFQTQTDGVIPVIMSSPPGSPNEVDESVNKPLLRNYDPVMTSQAFRSNAAVSGGSLSSLSRPTTASDPSDPTDYYRPRNHHRRRNLCMVFVVLFISVAVVLLPTTLIVARRTSGAAIFNPEPPPPVAAPSAQPTTFSMSGAPSSSPFHTEPPTQFPEGAVPSSPSPVYQSQRPSSSPSPPLPSIDPASIPTRAPAEFSSRSPSDSPISLRSGAPTGPLSIQPSDVPSGSPTLIFSDSPTGVPSSEPDIPSHYPSLPPVTQTTLSPSSNPSSSPSDSPSLFDFLVSISFDGGAALSDTTSPQYQAYSWLERNQNLDLYSEQRLTQRYVLATVFYGMGGASWTDNSMWLSDVSECEWFSRSIDACGQGRGDEIFQKLVLYYNNVQGTIPPEIGLLSANLDTIHLNGGPNLAISGSIPAEVSFLTNLMEVRLANNALTGRIPTALSVLENLELFDVSNNQLQDDIPAAIGQWRSVRDLNLSGNQLSGLIPPALGNMTRLTRLTLDNNSLSGQLPSTIVSLRDLRHLSFPANRISSLPSEIGRLTGLEILDASNNELSGPLLTQIGSLFHLRSLRIAFNSFSGALPVELGHLTRLVDILDLSHNQFSGSIPDDFVVIRSRLRILSLRSNFLVGQVPDSFRYLNRLVTLHLDNNNFSDEVMPEEVCRVFNETLPAIYVDCDEVTCPCCNYCCTEDEGCECRYYGNEDKMWKCY